MATEAGIPAPICETIRDQVGNIIIEQATTILINKLPQEEKNQADSPSEPPSVEGDTFLTPPSIDEVHSDVNNISLDASKVTEKTDQMVKNEPQKDDHPLEAAANEETSPKGIQQNAEETKVTEKTEGSSLTQVDSSQTESVEQLEKENEKLQLTEVSTESAVIIDKIKDEAEDLRKAEIFENEENTRKEEAQMEKPVDPLHVVFEGQDSKTSCPEEKTMDENQQVVAEEKTIDAVDTKKEVLESFPTVVSSYPGEGSTNANLDGVTQKEVLEVQDVSVSVSNEEIEEKPKIKVEEWEIETQERLEKENGKPSPLPLAEEGSFDETMVTHEAQDEGELWKAELCENEEIRENILLKIDSKVDEPDDTLHEASDETSSLLLDRKTEDTTVDVAEIKEENSENVASIVSNEKIEADSLIQVDCPEMKDGGHMDEVKTQDENPRGVKLFGKEINEGDVLLNEEVQIEKPVESSQAAIEDIKATENPYGVLGDKTEEKTIDAAESNEKTDELQDTPQDNNGSASKENIETTSSLEEQSLATDSQAIISTKRIDATDTKEVTHEVQNVATTIPHEYVEENSVIQADCTQMEHLEKESENQSSIEAQTEENNDKESENMHELKDRDIDLIKTEFLENEENTGSNSVKEEAEVEKPIESLNVVTADIKACDSIQYTEIIEKQIETSDPQGISSNIIEEKTIDAANTKEETLEDIATNPPGVLADKTEEKTIDLAESNEKTDELQDTPEDNKGSASNEDVQTTSSLAEQSLTTNSQAIMSTRTSDAIDTEVTDEVQNVETTPHENTEENSAIQVDCTQMEHEEHLEKGSEHPSLGEAQPEENNDKETENMHEPIDRGSDLNKDELLENEKNTGIDSVKEEAQIEEPIDSLKVVIEDIKACDSSQYTEIKEQIQTVDPQEISSEIIEERTIDAADTKESLEDIATNVPSGDHKDNQTVEVDGPQKPSLEKASTRSVNDDESPITHEAELVDESSIKADLFENEKNTEEILVKEEASIESLQIATEDITASASVQDRETTSLEEQSRTANPQENESDQKEDKTNDEIGVKEKTPEDKDFTTTIPSEETKEKSLIQDDCSEEKQNEQLEKESENPPLIETPIEETKESTLVMEEAHEEKLIGSLQVATDDIEASGSGQDTEATNSVEELITSRDTEEISGENTEEKTIDAADMNEATLEDVATTIPAEDTGNNSLIKEDCSQIDHIVHLEKESENSSLTESSSGKTTESTLVEEETEIEKLTDQFQVANMEIKASSSGSDPEKCSIEEQIQTADPQDISSDKREEKLIDAAYTEDETVDMQITPNVSNGDSEDNSPIEVDCTEKQSLEKVSKDSNDDVSTITYEAKSVDESSIKADLIENEKNTEGTLVEEVPIDPSQEVAEDIKTVVSLQDRATSSPEERNPIANPQEIKHGHEESKRNDETCVTQETPEDKNVAPTMPQEDAKENLQIQMGYSKLECDEHLEKESENPSSTETPTGYTTGSTLVTEEAEVEKLTDSLQLATKDINGSASGQDTETRSTEEQILTTDPQEDSGEKTEEKAIDAADTKEPTLENIETTIPHEGTEVDCSKIEQNEHLEKESENPSLMEGPSGYITESTLVKEEAQVGKLSDQLQVATENIKACSGAEPETSSIEEQIRTVDPQEISSDKTEEKPLDAAHTKDETVNVQQDIATNVSNGDNEDNLPTGVDATENQCLESTGIADDDASKITHDATCVDESSIEADLFESRKNTAGTFVKDEVPTEPLQEVAVDIETLSSDQDRQTSSPDERSPTADPQELVDDHKETETNEPDDKNIAPTMPLEDVKENSQIQVDCSQMECEEHLEQESENPCSTDTLTGDAKGSTLGMKEAQVEKLIDSLNEAIEDFKASPSLTEIICMEEQVLTTDPQETPGEKIEEVTIDAAATNKEAPDIEQDMSANVSNGEDEDNSPIESKESTDDDVSTITNDIKSVDESSTKADSFENEKNTGGTTLIKEVPIEPSHEVGEDIKALESVQDRETSSPEEQNPTVDPQEVVDDHKENKITDATPEDKNDATTTPQEDTKENSQIQVDCSQRESEKHLEKKNEDTSLTEIPTGNTIESTLAMEEAQTEKLIDCLQVTTEDAKASASVQDKQKSSTEEQVLTTDSGENSDEITEERTTDAAAPSKETLEIQDIVTNAPTGDNEDTSPTKVYGAENPYLEKASIGKDNDDESTITHEVKFVDESSIIASLCEDEKDTKAVFVKEEASSESLQVAAEHIEEMKVSASSKDTEISYIDKLIITEDAQEISDNKTEEKAIDAIDTVETLVVQDIMKDGPGDNEDNLPIKEVGSQKPFFEAEKMDVLENDVQVCLASAHDSDINQERQKPEEAYLPSSDEKITANIMEEDNKENEVVVDVDATKRTYTEQLEQDDTAKCLIDDQKPTEIEQDKTEGRQEKAMLDEKVEEIIETTSTSVNNDIFPKSSNESAEIDDFTTESELTIDKEELHMREITGEDEEPNEDKIKEDEAREEKIPDISPATPDMIETTEQDITRLPSESPKEICTGRITGEANISYETTDTRENTVINNDTSLEDIHIKSRSGGDLETKIDNEAPEIMETVSCNMEEQQILSTSVGETSALIPQCETDECEHGSIGSVTAEKSDSNEVEFAHGENQNEFESKNQVLESTVKDESCDIISKVEEVKTNEDNFELAEGKPEAEDRFEPKETADENEPAGIDISREKIKEEEDEYVDGYHLVSCKEEVITKSHLDDEVKQEEEMRTEDIFQVIKNANETDKGSKDFEEPNGTVVAEALQKSLVNESIDRSLHQEKGEKTIEEFTTISDTEEAQGLDHAYTKAIEDSREKDYEVGKSLEAEDQIIKHHDPSQESHVRDSQVKMAQKDGPMDPQSVREISEDVQKSKEAYIEVSNKEKLVKDPKENIKASVSSEYGYEERTSQETSKLMEYESKDKPSLSDLLHIPVKETLHKLHHSADEKEPTTCREELHAEKTDEVEHEEAKTDEAKDDEEQSNEERKSDLCSEAPVMVEAGETDAKVAHKKSHNLLSGVGSKVKHSIAKVKKAITGKSSHPKPPSPK